MNKIVASLGYRAVMSASALALTMAATSGVAHAQQTTSSIRGVVTDDIGTPLSNVSITVTDSRTNQTRTRTTNSDGAFSIPGLSVGGPYIVVVEAPGRQTQRVEDIFTSVGGDTGLTFDLPSLGGVAPVDDVIVVSGTRSATLAPVAIGPSSTFGLETLSTLPSINRDIRDTISLDPRVIIDETNDDNISCLGGNNRANAFTVDGVRQNDSFGLNASGFPSRNASPIPFDSIQEVSVEFAPFDVEYGQFTGCAINVVTTSGTNDLHGSAFFVYSDDSFFGDSLRGENEDESTEFDFNFENLNWGGSLAGPIIKDKLFFAVTYEEFADTNFINVGPAELGFANDIESSLAQVQSVQDIVENIYGLPTGGIPNTVDEENTRVLARLDWLINDQHRAEFTYSYLDELFIERDTGGFADIDFQFLNSFEGSGTRADSFSLRLFSNWTDNFSTEVRLSRNDIEDIQGPVGGGEAQDENPIPRLIVNTFDLDADGNVQTDNDGNIIFNDDGILAAGPGTFRSANALEQTIDQFKFKAEYLAGNHTFTAGYELDRLEVFNLFITDATGAFQFDGVDAFAAGQASTITGNGSFSGDPNDAAAEFTRNIHSFYIQDEWQLTENLTLLGGLRYDMYDSNDRPTISQSFTQRYGFANDTSFNGLEAFLPRLGFTYQSPYDLFGSTTVSGGIGVFAGADPSVFFSNAFTNFGGSIGFGGTFGGDCDATDLVVDPTNPVVPSCVIAQQQAEAALGQGRTDAIDPNIELPTTTRYNIGFSHLTDFNGAAKGFFDGWNVGVDYIHSQNENALDFVDLTLANIGTVSDGRPTFNAVDPLLEGCDAVFNGPRIGFVGPAAQLAQGGACDAGGDDQDILLTNVDGDSGNSDVISIQAAKRWDYDNSIGRGAISINAGYAYTDVTDVNPLTSATATSNFEEVATASLNRSTVSSASSFSQDTITFSGRVEQEFFKDLTTALTVRYRGRSGRNFSFAFDSSGNDFGDSDNEDRNLLFIPELNDANVVFATEADELGFNQFIQEQGLENLRGSIIGRNTQSDPFFSDLDMRIEQEFPVFVNKYLPDAKGLFFIDFDNILNMIDDGNNVFEEFRRGDVNEAVPVLDVEVLGNGTFLYSDFDNRLLSSNGGGLVQNTAGSLWQVQFGVRFDF